MSPPLSCPPKPWRQITALAHLAGFSSASFLIDRLWRAIGVTPRAGRSPLDDAPGMALPIPPEGAWEWALALTRGAILPAALEELFFRGLLFEIVRRTKGKIPAILISAGLFGLAHPGWAHGAAAGLLGLYLGTLRAGWGLALPIAAHTLNNALALFWDASETSGGLMQAQGLADPWLWLAIGLVCNSVATLRQEMCKTTRVLPNRDPGELQQNPLQDENGM